MSGGVCRHKIRITVIGIEVRVEDLQTVALTITDGLGLRHIASRTGDERIELTTVWFLHPGGSHEHVPHRKATVTVTAGAGYPPNPWAGGITGSRRRTGTAPRQALVVPGITANATVADLHPPCSATEADLHLPCSATVADLHPLGVV